MNQVEYGFKDKLEESNTLSGNNNNAPLPVKHYPPIQKPKKPNQPKQEKKYCKECSRGMRANKYKSWKTDICKHCTFMRTEGEFCMICSDVDHKMGECPYSKSEKLQQKRKQKV